MSALLSQPLQQTAQRDAIVESLVQQFAANAAERDKAGGHAEHERTRIRASGLMTLAIPEKHGGQGARWSDVYGILRRLAEVDSALAHVFGFHHLQMASIQLYGSPSQQSALFEETVRESLFWGNALNPLDRRTLATPVPGGFEFHGTKSYCSGSVGSDRLLMSGWHAATQTPVIAVVPTRHPGVTVASDWDSFGQKQTDSGTVTFDRVFVADAEILQAPGVAPTPHATLRTLVAQLLLTNLYVGIGLGAFREARQQIVHHTRPSVFSTATAAAQDPYVQHRFAELWLLLRPAIALANAAALQLDDALQTGVSLSATQRGELAIAVYEAKALAHKAGLEVSSQFFELTGARSTSGTLGLDRFWRNVRVHTLHDPIDYKYRDLGRYLLEGQHPTPTPYS